MLGDEGGEHGRGDPAGVATYLGHVHEPDPLNVPAHRRSKLVDARTRHRHQHRLCHLESLTHEAHDAEGVVVSVEVGQCLVYQPDAGRLRWTQVLTPPSAGE